MDSVPEPNPVPPLSISDRIQIATTYIIRVPWTVITTLLRRWNPLSTYQPPPLREHLFRHVMTCLGNNLPMSETNRSINRGGTDILTSPRYSHLQNQIYHPVRTPSFSGFWICRGLTKEPLDPRDADVFLFHCHGGGYVAGHPAAGAVAHLYLAEKLQEKGLSCAVFSLDYMLAPKGRFPVQVDEAVAAYEWIRRTLGVKRERIVVIGDSAGGHLVLALLTRLYLRKGQWEEQGEDVRPGAAVLLSPWVNLHSSHPRVLALHWEERLFKIGLDKYCELVMRGASKDVDELYGNFAVAGERRGSWKEILPRKTWVSAGEEELVFRYDIEDLVERAREDGADVGLEVEDGMNHAWQSAEAFGQQSRFLELAMGEDGGLMVGYRRIAEVILEMRAIEQ
ncbi:alpha/beta hydrolase fold protein [Aspergillus steynii IBT 23096]|uniref:Alpha/beta hydrolase fold protein n=1 Tax=Aspergillus steynii IBT 23096 TaxID=1392250 RepID=A0A2I2GMN8_9EURO|nr:alpha/beta hydrolase fold protein [Aspergillus steynii IBT 23096]PLB54134.1 alpha/beta hydrolase fold protein [Aspergillus steynii IBT 23096]